MWKNALFKKRKWNRWCLWGLHFMILTADLKIHNWFKRWTSFVMTPDGVNNTSNQPGKLQLFTLKDMKLKSGCLVVRYFCKLYLALYISYCGKLYRYSLLWKPRVATHFEFSTFRSQLWVFAFDLSSLSWDYKSKDSDDESEESGMIPESENSKLKNENMRPL